MHDVFRLTLRTIEVDAARRFYAAVLGDAAQRMDIVELHEQARARGARPHWLGFIEVADVERAAAELVARGATALGPRWVNPAGLEAAVLRDGGGAIIAVARYRDGARPDAFEAVSCVLQTGDLEGAKATYGALFGWAFEAPVDIPGQGALHRFAWAPGQAPAGGMMGIAGRPGVHPHWLFLFPVADLDAAVAAARGAGGLVLAPTTLPSGERAAVCDDPQGAAFGLIAPGR